MFIQHTKLWENVTRTSDRSMYSGSTSSIGSEIIPRIEVNGFYEAVALHIFIYRHGLFGEFSFSLSRKNESTRPQNERLKKNKIL